MKSSNVYIVPTRYGFLYGIIVFILICISTVFSRTDLLASCIVLVTFGVVCMQQGHMNVVSLELSEVDTQSAFAGEKTPWRFKILNRSSTASFSINIMENNVDIPAREVAVENIAIVGKTRGYYQVTEIKLSSTYPLGLFYAWKLCEVNLSYFIYPALGNLGDSSLPIHNRKAELDSQDDFLGHREFIPGDSSHHIDWKLQARQQKLLIKLFESPRTEAVIFDWNQIAGSVESRLSVLARAVFECHRSQKSYGMILPQITIPIGEGLGHYQRCLQYLAKFELEGAPSVQTT